MANFSKCRLRECKFFETWHVKRVIDWLYSTFHLYVAQGIYLPNWCSDINTDVGGE